MKLRASHTCCGCVSLLVGVEVIAFLTLMACITVIASISSSKTVTFEHFTELSPRVQVAIGTWSFFGIIVSIMAGVAALYRHEAFLRSFYMYLIVSCCICLGIPMWLLGSGHLCDSMVSKEVQKLGSSFVCGFTEGFIFWWTLVISTILAYAVYVVWSAAEEIRSAPTPELMKYSSALKGIHMSPGPEWHAVGMNRAAAFRPHSMSPGLLPGSIGMAPGAAFERPSSPRGRSRSPSDKGDRSWSPSSRSTLPPTAGSRSTLPPTASVRSMGPSYGAAVPQSFFPSPGSMMF